jgi:hypothetical protein
MPLRYAIYLVAGMIGPALALGQSSLLTVIPNDHPIAGRAVVIEVKAPSLPNPKISWTKKGDGEFTTTTLDVIYVKFVPHEPGSTVTIMCDLNVSDGTHTHYETTLNVLNTTATVAEVKTPPAPQPVPPTRTPPGPPPPVSPTGDLRLSDMPEMVSSGWMGDATPEKGGAATLDEGYKQGCMSAMPCVKVDYSPSNGKLGWAAFAWQRVIDDSGNGSNWGQSPGADLSSAHYRSIRINAKGLPNNSGAFPTVQFKSGGNVAPQYGNNLASYAVAGHVEQLTGQFQEFCLSLENKNLSNTVSPFTVVVARPGNMPTASFLLDNIRFSTQPCH